MKRMMLSLLLMLPLPVLATPPLAPESVLQINNRFTDQNGQDFVLASRRGNTQLVAMFYTSCRYVCPLIIDSAFGVERSLSADERRKLHVLLVSLDPARDTPEALMSVVAKRHIDTRRWTLARTDDAGVRVFAALIGTRYRKLSDGDFNHTSALVLLDAEGRVLARTETLGAIPDPEFLTKVKRALQQ